MPQSISIVLPVRNAQATLRRTVGELLDLVPDLASNFEILIVDDASGDATEEVARRLCVEYPQIQLICHRTPQGLREAVQSGLERSCGELIFVKDDDAPVRPSDLQHLWDMRTDDELVMARTQPSVPDAPQPLDPSLIKRLMSWGAALEKTSSTSQGGIQMIRRRGAEKLSRKQIDSAANTDESPSPYAKRNADDEAGIPKSKGGPRKNKPVFK